MKLLTQVNCEAKEAWAAADIALPMEFPVGRENVRVTFDHLGAYEQFVQPKYFAPSTTRLSTGSAPEMAEEYAESIVLRTEFCQNVFIRSLLDHHCTPKIGLNGSFGRRLSQRATTAMITESFARNAREVSLAAGVSPVGTNRKPNRLVIGVWDDGENRDIEEIERVIRVACSSSLDRRIESFADSKPRTSPFLYMPRDILMSLGGKIILGEDESIVTYTYDAEMGKVVTMNGSLRNKIKGQILALVVPWYPDPQAAHDAGATYRAAPREVQPAQLL